MEAALWVISHLEWDDDHTRYKPKSYDYDILEAVNLGDDTDTVGAVTGGLLGIMHGLGLSGKSWFERLRNKEQILECLW